MTLQESLLWPLSVAYGAAAELRARAYGTGILRARRLKGRVISVGNLTVGGTGKTPTVLWIAQRLLAEGKKVGILTRGYRGQPSAVRENHPGETRDTKRFSTSDEVQLLRSRLGEEVKFGVGADRYKQGLALAREGVDWFILDDGFQHLQLARDVDIVLIDASKPFGGGRLLPAGRLREPRGALKRADLIVITRSNHAPAIESVIRRYSASPIYYAHTELAGVRSYSQTPLNGAEVRDRKFFAFCGIGNPSAFITDLRDWGFPIAGHKFFRDHHRYSPADMSQIQKEAAEAGATALICTEKDSFNLAGVSVPPDLWICTISLRVEQEEEFWRAMMARAESVMQGAR